MIIISRKELMYKLALDKRFLERVFPDSIVILVYYLFLLLIEEVLFDKVSKFIGEKLFALMRG